MRRAAAKRTRLDLERYLETAKSPDQRLRRRVKARAPSVARNETVRARLSCESQRCLNVVFGDSLNAVSDESFKCSADERYPK
jgi:hypothetical protein